VPSEVVAHEVYAQLSTPLLWRFLREMPNLGDQWAEHMIGRLHRHCGRRLQALWTTTLDAREAPALVPWLDDGQQTLGALLRSRENRDRRLDIVPLLILRGEETTLGPDDDFRLAAGDQILFAGEPRDHRALLETMHIEYASEFVLAGRHVPAGWLWRRLTRTQLSKPRR
jgi:hypothetical protein